MGIFKSRRSLSIKRSWERKKSETENAERSTDSGVGSSEERDGYNELDAPRDITPAESRSQIDQSTAQHDSQGTQPTKKRKLSLEQKHAKLDEYISSEESNFTCFATNQGLNNFAHAILFMFMKLRISEYAILLNVISLDCQVFVILGMFSNRL